MTMGEGWVAVTLPQHSPTTVHKEQAAKSFVGYCLTIDGVAGLTNSDDHFSDGGAVLHSAECLVEILESEHFANGGLQCA